MKWLQKLKGVEHANPPDGAPIHEPPAPEPEPEPAWAPGQLVMEHNGHIQVRCNTRAEAKLAIKEVKLKKKELQIGRREIVQEIAAVRAEYRSNVAGRYPTAGSDAACPAA